VIRWPRKLGRKRLPGFLQDRRAVTSIEFGLLATPFLGLICAIMEMCWVSFNAEVVQAAVTAASRQILTGTAQASGITDAPTFVSKLLCPSTGPRLIPNSYDCSKFVVDIRTASDFLSADTSHTFYTQPLKFCLGQPSTIVVVRVAYPQSAILPLSLVNVYLGLRNDFPTQSGWVHLLVGTAVFQTEPYAGTSAC
jgi:Flp pilus assembly protein TadG